MIDFILIVILLISCLPSYSSTVHHLAVRSRFLVFLQIIWNSIKLNLLNKLLLIIILMCTSCRALIFILFLFFLSHYIHNLNLIYVEVVNNIVACIGRNIHLLEASFVFYNLILSYCVLSWILINLLSWINFNFLLMINILQCLLIYSSSFLRILILRLVLILKNYLIG